MNERAPVFLDFVPEHSALGAIITIHVIDQLEQCEYARSESKYVLCKRRMRIASLSVRLSSLCGMGSLPLRMWGCCAVTFHKCIIDGMKEVSNHVRAL